MDTYESEIVGGVPSYWHLHYNMPEEMNNKWIKKYNGQSGSVMQQQTLERRAASYAVMNPQNVKFSSVRHNQFMTVKED